jgi:hypothetical protein
MTENYNFGIVWKEGDRVCFKIIPLNLSGGREEDNSWLRGCNHRIGKRI